MKSIIVEVNNEVNTQPLVEEKWSRYSIQLDEKYGYIDSLKVENTNKRIFYSYNGQILVPERAKLKYIENKLIEDLKEEINEAKEAIVFVEETNTQYVRDLLSANKIEYKTNI